MAMKPQRSSPQKTPKSHKHLFTDTWLLEIGALILGICAFVVIIVLLAQYDGKQQFQWHGVTLNAVVSVLATIARIGIGVPIAEALAQWKWMHFSKGYEPLGDFDLLDDASRGTRGSILLLWEKRSLTFTSIGAWVVILSVAVEPFFQQIISFEDAVSYTYDKNVNITYSTLWDGGTFVAGAPSSESSSENATGLYVTLGDYGSVSDLTLDFQAQAAVLFGLSTTLEDVNQQLKTSCPSGNCTWPPYMTLGTCSKCNDVTDQVIRSQKVDYPMAWFIPNSGHEASDYEPANLTSYSLPNGLALDNRNPNQIYVDQSYPLLMTARGNVAPSQSVSFKDASTMLWSTAVLQVPNASLAIDGYGEWTDPTALNVKATECALYLCVKEYTSKVQNDQLIETFTDIASTRDPDSWQVMSNYDGEAAETIGYIYLDGVSPAVDALYTISNFLNRTDLSISVPTSDRASNLDTNKVHMVNATQEGIYTLSEYITNIFNNGFFTNEILPDVNTFKCNLNGTSIPCGHLNNVTGMVVVQNALVPSNTTLFYPPVMSVLHNADNLNDVFTTLAESITTAMRRPGPGTPQLSGQLGTLHTLLRVRWAWITLPLICMLVSTTFLLVSIYEAHTDMTPLWKSGGLAYLAHGLDAQTRERMQHAELTSELEVAAEEIKVKLWRGEDGVLMLRGEKEAEEEVKGKESGEQRASEEHEMVPLSAGGRGDV